MSDGMGREPAYLSSHATNRYFIPNWGKNNDYSDVTSLKDARYAITAEFLGKKGYPLWTVKYASEAAFNNLPVTLSITDKERRLIDNIVTICMERDLRNPALVKETIDLISELRYEMKNILNVDAAFADGFKNYLMQLDFVNIQESDVDDVKLFIEQNLQSTVGYWTEEEVEKKALQWNSARNSLANTQTTTNDNGWQQTNGMVSEPPVDNTTQTLHTNSNALDQKRKQAKKHIESIVSLDDAKALLTKLCDEGGEWLLDKING